MKLHLLISYFIYLLLIACQNNEKKETNSKSFPNVIIILADDQGYGDLGSHGHPILQTPNLDAFAKKSVELTNFHVSTSCSPTRASIMTGRNANRNGSWHTIAGCSILNKEEVTMAEVFKKNNYQTAMFGKWHLGDNYPYRPQDRGFDEAFYCGGGGVGQTPDYWNNDYFDDTYFRNGTPEKTQGYCTDVWFDETIEYIDQHKEKPFFVYLAPNAAHAPFNVPPEYLALYEKEDLPAYLKRFNGMLTNLDFNFGKLLDYLDKVELSDNTVVIYTTDNGTTGGVYTEKETGKTVGYNADLRGMKISNYDGGHRVPFFIRYPDGKIEGGRKSEELVAHVDLLPTLAALCDLDYKIEKPLDGRDCLPLIMGEKEIGERFLVTDTQRNQWPEKGRKPCVMSKDWRLVNETELYNTKIDPSQKDDIASQYPEKVKEMQDFYNGWWESILADQHHSPLLVGDEHENPTLLTIHDLHSSKNIPWNQSQIRKGDAIPDDGYYGIDIAASGSYEFSLSRYPPSSNLALNEVVISSESFPFFDGYPEGKSLNFVSALVEVDSLKFESYVDLNQNSVKVNAVLNKGKAQLKVWFLLESGGKIPAYYTNIRKF